MCGIAGFVSSQYNVSDLSKMAETLQHRGPDANNNFSDHNSNVGLTHTRLSVIDLSEGANQPMTSSSGRYVIVFNGEIYNFKELIKGLEYPFSTGSDTEAVLALFEKYGSNMVTCFNGMFAIAIWDTVDQTLHLFRDRLGIKPLYFYQKGTTLLFASELKALKTVIKDTLTINREAVQSYLHLGYIPEPLSIWDNISKFPSGSKATFAKGVLKLEKYWSPSRIVQPSTISSENEALDLSDIEINASVKRRLISDVPLGTFLSGGIDSSLVSAIASQNTNEQLKTFSIGFEENTKNEAPFAKKVAEQLQSDHHEFIVSQNEIKKLIPSLMDVYDEPYCDSSAFPTMIVSELARKHVTVTLSGDGGDELFHGYGAYTWANRFSNKSYIQFRKLIKMGLSLGDNRMKRVSHLFDFRKNDDLKAHIFSQEQYLFSAKEVEELTKDEFVFSSCRNDFARTFTPSESQAFFDLNYYLKDDLLTKVDRASMHYGLETRVPLLDHKVVELALNISPELKTKNGSQKYLLKELLYKYLPKELFDRPKAGFSIPLETWLQGELSYLIDDYVLNGKLHELGLNMEYVAKLCEDFRKGKTYLYNRIWQLIVLAMWIEQEYQV